MRSLCPSQCDHNVVNLQILMEIFTVLIFFCVSLSTSFKPAEALPTHKPSEVHQFGADAFDKFKNVDSIEVMDVDDASSTVESVSKKRKSWTKQDKYSNLNSCYSTVTVERISSYKLVNK